MQITNAYLSMAAMSPSSAKPAQPVMGSSMSSSTPEIQEPTQGRPDGDRDSDDRSSVLARSSSVSTPAQTNMQGQLIGQIINTTA